MSPGRQRHLFFPEEHFPGPFITEEMIEDLQEELKPFRGKVSPRELRPTLVQEIKHKHYKNFVIAVGGAAFADQPLGLDALDIVADEMTVITYPAGSLGLSYRLNKRTNDDTPIVAVGQEEDQFEIEEVYVSDDGAGAAGNLIIRVTWNPYLIRLTV